MEAIREKHFAENFVEVERIYLMFKKNIVISGLDRNTSRILCFST